MKRELRTPGVEFLSGTSGGPPHPSGPAAGLVDELTIIIGPGDPRPSKRDGFGESLELEHLRVRQSPFATFIGYRVKK